MVSNNVIKLWLFPRNKNNKCRQVTSDELKITGQLSHLKSEEYLYSRGCVRYALSNFFGISPLKIPLKAPPGKPPTLKKGFGYITFSHCRDALLVGWSSKKIGVDIERKDRKFFRRGIAKKFYSFEEKKFLNDMDDDLYNYNVLKYWVLKESAIKWQKGTISKDLSHWEVKNNFHSVCHNYLKYKLRAFDSQFELWAIGLAYEQSMNGKIKTIISKVS